MTRSTVGRLAIGAIVGLMLAQGVAFGADPLRLTEPVQATNADLDPLRTWGAPFMLVHPTDANLIVAGMHEFRQKKSRLAVSTDAGQTWTFRDADPALSSYPFSTSNNSNIFQAPMAWGSDNSLYMALAAWDTQDTRDAVSVQLAKSTDLGESWTTALVRNARGADETNRPVTAVAVDTTGSQDVVYVSWRTRRDASNADRGPDAPTLAVSTDGGATFADPVYLSDEVFAEAATRADAIAAASGPVDAEDNAAVNFGGGNPMVVVDDSGTAYVGWKSAYRNVSPTPPAGVFVSKSTDNGQTWSTTQVQPFSAENASGFVIPMLTWTDAGGSQGTVHMVTAGTDHPDINSYGEIFYLQSTDGAATWTEPRILRDVDPSLLAGGYLPYIDSSPNGRVDVTWFDTRDDPGIRANDVYYAYSTDNGATWSENIRVTDQTIDRRFGVWGNNFDQNSPPNVVSANSYALFGWDDTRLSRGEDGVVLAADPVLEGEGIGGGVQDVFVSTVQFSELGAGTSNAAKAVLAGVIGLLAVGLVLVVVAVGGRARARTGSSGVGTSDSRGRTSAGVK